MRAGFRVLARGRSRRGSGSPTLGLLLLDLDGFKPVNDRFGHMVGDSVLRIVGKRLSGLVRGTDMVARVGGDEFCIVQTRIHGAGETLALARRAVAAISQPVAIAPDDGDDPELLLECANQALYAVKRSGRCGYRRDDLAMMRPPSPLARSKARDCPPPSRPSPPAPCGSGDGSRDGPAWRVVVQTKKIPGRSPP